MMRWSKVLQPLLGRLGSTRLPAIAFGSGQAYRVRFKSKSWDNWVAWGPDESDIGMVRERRDCTCEGQHQLREVMTLTHMEAAELPADEQAGTGDGKTPDWKKVREFVQAWITPAAAYQFGPFPLAGLWDAGYPGRSLHAALRDYVHRADCSIAAMNLA